jgi:beta-lactamase superfamily II metal-dependent hydrolase
MRKSTSFSLLALLFVAITIWTLALQKPDHKLHIYFLDIGQGDSIYIRTPSGNDILVDGGPNDKVLSQLSQVMPINDRTIDLVIATHNDSDHVGGLIPVLNNYKVNEVWINGAIHTTQTYFNLMAAIKKQKADGANIKVVTRGLKENWVDVNLVALAPIKSF